MHKTFSYTARVNSSCHVRLGDFLEQQRLLYNAALEERIGAYQKARKSASLYDQLNGLTELRTDSEYSSYNVLCQRSCLHTVDRAFKAFFRRLKAGQKSGFPRFKSKDRGIRSFSTSRPLIKSKGRWHFLTIKGIGKFRFKGEIIGKVIKARIVKTPIRVVIQLVVELPDVQSSPQPPLGIDVGVSARVTLSDGQRWTKNEVDRERLTVLQQRLSAAKKGSKNRQKRKSSLAKEWQRVTTKERNILHGMTADLVKKTNCYYVEDLDVQGMMKNHSLARSIAEQQWGNFVGMLAYKAESAGGWVRKVDPAYTSQDCSRCGTRVEKTLSDRLHVCPACHLEIDRDWNAARNILNRGLTVSPPSGGNSPSGALGAENCSLH